jgi:BirA family transcriptional regulator, biotin operon repressor / biotin---[acetyl-CoA-carboxylase] ligase
MPSPYDDLDRPPLNAAALRRALVLPGSLWTTLDVLVEAPSTNAVLAEHAAAGAASGEVLITEHQTAGRGRLDRVWMAPARSGLTMSVLVRPHDVAIARWPWIPLLTGLAVAAAVQREAQVAAGLKWPNDVVVADRKLAGVLVERVESPGHPPAAVIGMGLNVSLRSDELPVPSATSLTLEGTRTTDRTVLARAVLRALEGLLGDWQRHSGDPGGGLQTAYVDACTTVGQRVEVLLPDGCSLRGDAVGIDDSGRLLVRSGEGQVAVSAGDVLHLRRLA